MARANARCFAAADHLNGRPRLGARQSERAKARREKLGADHGDHLRICGLAPRSWP